MKKIILSIIHCLAIFTTSQLLAQWNLFGTSVRLNNSAWNVGIGVPIPNAKLDINTLVIGQHALRVQTMAATKFLVANNGGTAIGVVALPPVNGLYVSGNAGIGTNVPNSKLHVNAALAGQNGLRVQIAGLTKLFVANGGGTSIGSSATPPVNGLYVAGRLGVGTSVPERKLHVFNGSAGAVVANVNAPLVVENSTHSYINVLAPAASERGILFGDPGNAQDGGIVYIGSNNSMHFRTNGNVTRMTLSSTGNLDITGGTLSFGSVETFADAGSNTISANSTFIPTIDNFFDLGSPTKRWDEVWATDGTINTSDERDKTNIKDLEYGIKEIMKIRSTRFSWKDREGSGQKLGLIAQELQKVLPEVVRDWQYSINEETGAREKVPAARMGVLYADIIPVLIKGMQEQQTQIEAKDNKISELQSHVDQLQTKYDQLYNLLLKKGLLSGSEITSATTKGFLQSNTPNPFNDKTTIRYGLSPGSKGQINVYSASGSLVKTLVANESGQSVLSADGLQSGTYTYSLVADGKIVGSKKMVVIK
jgi:hypothetical protein